jgi:hypothetical protein
MPKVRPAAGPVAEILEGCYPKARMSSAEGHEEPTEATEQPAPERATSDKPKKKKKAKAPPPPPMSEEQINSPTNQTLGMLGVIGIMTLCMWIFARGGCNYHPPKETRDPRKVELVDLARDPKDAAMEFELRFATKSFGGALDLVKGPMVELVKAQQTACDADANCAQKASDLRGSVQVVGALLERDAFRAVTRVTTSGLKGADEKHIVRLERDQQIWKVVGRENDDGTFKPRPQPVMQGPSGHMLMRQPGMPGSEAPPAASSSTETKK